MSDEVSSSSKVDWQYKSPTNLNVRASLHSRFSTNSQGWFEWVFDQFDLPDTCRVLEIGCGAGALWQANRNRIPRSWCLVLTDASEGMLETIRENVSDLPQVESITKADALSLPFESETFDAVVANHVLYHVSHLESALIEANRVLKTGGALFASTVGLDNMLELHDLLSECAADSSLGLEHHDVIGKFSLETGRSRIAKYFANIKLKIYEDSLEVTDVDALVAYAQSLATGTEPVLSGERLEQFKARVTDGIQKAGAFHIRKSAGMFVARKSSRQKP